MCKPTSVYYGTMYAENSEVIYYTNLKNLRIKRTRT